MGELEKRLFDLSEDADKWAAQFRADHIGYRKFRRISDTLVTLSEAVEELERNKRDIWNGKAPIETDLGATITIEEESEVIDDFLQIHTSITVERRGDFVLDDAFSTPIGGGGQEFTVVASRDLRESERFEASDIARGT